MNEQKKLHQPPPYRFFDTKDTRQELYTHCKRIGDYLHKNRVPSVLFLDRSARPAATGVREYWHAMYADQKLPNMYFINANGLKTKKQITVRDILKQRLQTTNEPTTSLPTEDRTSEVIKQEFREAYPQLMRDKDKPLLVFDTCIHSGETVLPVKELLRQLGFKDVRVGTIEDPPTQSVISADFYMREEGDAPAGLCRPFGHESSVHKTYDNVRSTRVNDPQAREQAQALRKEIQRIMQEKGKT